MRYFLVFFIFLALAFTPFQTEGQSESLSLEISLPNNRFILGENIDMTCTWANRGKDSINVAYDSSFLNPLVKVEVNGAVRKECAEEKWFSEWPQLAHRTFAPGERVVRELRLSGIGIVDAGDYEVSIHYDATGLAAFWDEVNIQRIKVESNKLSFSIVAPSGIDAALFNGSSNRCNQITMSREDILKKYPSSTYAGWILYNTCPPLTGNRLGSLQDPDKALRSFSDRGGGEENTLRHIEHVQAKLRDYAEPLGQFLQAHPDSPYAQDLRKRYAMCLGLTGHLPEAMLQIEMLAKGEGPKAEEARAFLADKETNQKAVSEAEGKPDCPE